MGDLTGIVVAVIGTLGTLGGIWLRLRHRAAKSGPSAAARWREQYELEKARGDLLEEQRDEARAGLVTKETALETTRHDLDDCTRQRDSAYADLRRGDAAAGRADDARRRAARGRTTT